VLRASQDNPAYRNLPTDDVRTGENYLDGQRIIYRDGLVESHAMAAIKPPTRRIKDKDAPDGFKYVPCDVVPIQKIGNADGPGKISVFDLMAMLLTDREWAEIGIKLFKRLQKMQNI
jgi:hypothetical protein